MQPIASPNLPLVSPQTSIRDTIVVIDRYAKGIAVVVDEERHLLATVTDGDIRRAILAGIDLGQPIMQLKQRQLHAPVTALVGTPESEILAILQTRTIRHLPLLDEAGRVSGLAVVEDILRQNELPVTGVIMAGGYGKRLMPLTQAVPKPMLPLNGRPLLEHTLERLRQAGIRSVNVATHYLSDSIVNHFHDGSGFGVQLNYFQEEEPLGTAGALARMSSGTEPLLVMNGDVLTDVDVRSMLQFHREHRSDLTIGVRQYEIEVPFGVVETNGNATVTGITEKPILRHFINAGIYLVHPDVCRLVPPNRYFDMPDLIRAVIESSGTVISFPIREYWLDIGHLEQYQKATADLESGVV